MEAKFILSCESTVDLPYDYVADRGIPVLFYSYTVDGKVYSDNMDRDPLALAKFYNFIKAGKLPSTSQINLYTYYDFFKELLQKGDVLHISLGSGMTPSVRNAVEAAEMLRAEFPDRKIEVIDSLSSCSGYGLVVDNTADLRDNGCTFEEAVTFAENDSKHTHHQFFSTDLRQFRRSGRVSGVAAAAATILGICPIMHLDETGHIIAYDKVRGKKRAIEETVRTAAQNARNGTEYNGKMFISHSNCLADAEETAALIRKTFPKLKDIRIYNIGSIIASHSGPGTVALFFTGVNRVDKD